jgi:hypothetical protein
MKRLDPALNSGSNQYVDGNANTGVGGTVLQAEALNHLQEEIAHVIELGGGVLDPNSKTQLRDKILALMAAALNAAPKPDGFEAASQAAMLSHGAGDGDNCIRTDQGNSVWLCIGLPSNNIANWREEGVPQSVLQQIAAANANANDRVSKTDTAAQTMLGIVNWPTGYNTDANAKEPLWGYLGNRLRLSNDPNIDILGDYPSGFEYRYNNVNGVGNPNEPPGVIDGDSINIVRITSGSSATVVIAVITNYQSGTIKSIWAGARLGANIIWQPLSAPSLGVNQTRQDVTPSRAAGVPYPNNTGAPIFISIALSANSTVQIDDGTSGNNWSQVQMGGGVSIGGITAVVPDGKNYRLTGGVSGVLQWNELR